MKTNTSISEFSFMLQPSSFGIGVFAVHNIPKGIPVFPKPSNLRILKLKDIPQSFLKFVIFINEEKCLAPADFSCLEVGWFINHGNNPNISKYPPCLTPEIQDAVDHKLQTLYTIQDIKAGDEILLDYNELDEPENLKEAYYKK